MTAKLMSHAGGVGAVVAVGATIVGVGIAQATRAYGEKFKRRWHAAKMGPAQEKWATRAAKGALEPVHDPHGTALRPKIVSAKAQGAGRSHSAVKPCNAGWRAIIIFMGAATVGIYSNGPVAA